MDDELVRRVAVVPVPGVLRGRVAVAPSAAEAERSFVQRFLQ